MDYKKIAGIVPGLQAVAMVSHNLPKSNFTKPNKTMGMKKMVKMGVKNMVGLAMIKPTAEMANNL